MNNIRELAAKRTREILGDSLQRAVDDVLDTFQVHPLSPEGVDIVDYMEVEEGIMDTFRIALKDRLLRLQNEKKSVPEDQDKAPVPEDQDKDPLMRKAREYVEQLDDAGEMEGCRDMMQVIDARRKEL